MRVRVLVQPTGLFNGELWPEPGGELDIHEDAARPMIDGGWLEEVKAEAPKTEKRPSQVKAEKRAE